MKDLTKVIDTLDSINKIMGCMKEHAHDGITIKTLCTDYTVNECGITLIILVENKYYPEYENSCFLVFSFGTDYIEVKETIIAEYNQMCEEMRANIEEDERLQND